MISDVLNKLKLYAGVHKDILPAAEFIKCFVAEGMKPGKYILNDEGMYANAEEYVSKPEKGRYAEAHRRYIDLQVVLEGREKIGISPLDGMDLKDSFDDAGDIGFYKGKIKQWVPMEAGSFVLIWPHEAHLPGTHLQSMDEVLKLVVKIPL